MNVKIVVDSTCDLPTSLATEHQITIVPLYINIGDQSFKDGVELMRSEFYARLPDYPTPPQTAAPSPDQFQQVYEHLLDTGASHVLSIHVAATLSSTVNSARLAAQRLPEGTVTVFDSRQLSLGTGLLALTAARAATTGATVADILPRLEAQIIAMPRAS